jgi:hypothetical protein
MSFAFDLWSLDDGRAHAEGILERCPATGAWPGVFQRWTESAQER